MSESGVPNGFHQIPGFPRYAIDENGIVISICPRNGQKKAKTWSDARRVKPWTDKLGYHRVQLFHDGNQRTVKVHRLVLLTFVGPCPAGMQCRHLDGNPGNNHVSNLTWGSSSENHRDKILHGTSGLGDKNGNAKLKAADVLEIRMRAANGENTSAIASGFPVTQTNVRLIILRKTWKHI